MKSASLHEVYSPAISQALKSALQQFEQKLPGFVSDAGLLHGVETRTSSPVCCAVLCCAALCCAVLCCAVLCYAVLTCIQTAHQQTFHKKNRASRHSTCPPFVVLITENWHANQAYVVLAWSWFLIIQMHFYRKSCLTVLVRCL